MRFDRPTAVADPDAAGAGTAARGPALRIANVDKRFPGVHALKDVSLEVGRGEVHAIVGENGAGKSTLMAVTAGALTVDAGHVEIGGAPLDHARPGLARELGLAIVYQEPALLPDLTVTENVMLGLPRAVRARIGDRTAWTADILAGWRSRSELHPGAYVRDLAPDERFIVEIARALAEDPALLILDEPTEHLSADDVERLFARIRALTEAGGTVVYISHRIPEVLQIADRVTVLRDGSIRGTREARDVTEDDVVRLIVGRTIASRFPPKAAALGGPRLTVSGLRGPALDGVDLTIRAGEIVGLAGIEDQGQRDTLRALAGLVRTTGDVEIDGTATSLRSSSDARRAGIAYVPGDRHAEGVLSALSVRENLTVRALGRLARAGVVDPARERAAAEEARAVFGIKTADLETPIDSLSGGNQQKTVLARALMTEPTILLAEEPTQGVDVGARADIYDILRSSAGRGSCVLVSSSDNAEIEGLCDRVLVFSRGRIIDTLVGDDVTEAAITQRVVTSTAGRRDDASRAARLRGLGRALRSDLSPAAVLAVIIVALGVWGVTTDSGYLSSANISSVLTLFAALAFIALGQQLVMLTAGIDLSVGPLTGLLVVVASFQLGSDRNTLGLVIGAAVVLGVALAVGAINWSLVWFVRIDPMIATLVTFMGIQGVSLLLRPEPGGTISPTLADFVNTTVGPVPVAAILAVGAGVAFEVGLRRSRPGWRVRAIGSDREAARRVGVRASRVLLAAYVGCAVLAMLGAFMLMGQVGSGDPNAGSSYTFTSIAAVVLGGASIFGGRGSFVGALAGALLVVQINTVAVFVDLSDAWQLYLLGGLTLIAAGFYSRTRGAAR